MAHVFRISLNRGNSYWPPISLLSRILITSNPGMRIILGFQSSRTIQRRIHFKMKLILTLTWLSLFLILEMSLFLHHILWGLLSPVEL